MEKSQVELLIESLDEAFHGPAWHGPSLRVALRGLNARQAAARPTKERHNLWELAVHCAYWKYAVQRRLLGKKEHTFAYPGHNFFARPNGSKNAKPSESDWKRDLALLSKTHDDLCDTVSHLDEGELDRPSRGSRQTPRFMIEGIAMHDVYHAGQIQLLRKLTRTK